MGIMVSDTDTSADEHALAVRYRHLKFHEARERACQEPTLEAALVFIAIWENDRAVHQALKGERGPNGQLWDTGFHYVFTETRKRWEELHPVRHYRPHCPCCGAAIDQVSGLYAEEDLTPPWCRGCAFTQAPTEEQLRAVEERAQAEPGMLGSGMLALVAHYRRGSGRITQTS